MPFLEITPEDVDAAEQALGRALTANGSVPLARLLQSLKQASTPSSETLNAACFWISRCLEGQSWNPEVAQHLARILLRTAGRVIIDGAGADASLESWPGTEEMALQWLSEIAALLGFRLTPDPGGQRQQP